MTPSVLQPPPMRPQVDPLAALPEQMPQQPPMPPQGAPMPQQAPQQMPDAPPPPPPDAQQAPQRGAWSMTGDPRKDMALYMSNPEEYTKALIANASKGAAPTDVEVMQSHIVEAAKAGDWGRVKALTEMMNKTTNLPPISLRQGVAIDPVTHEPVFQVGQAPVGSMVDYEGGKPVGQHVINGAPQTIATLAAAEAGGKAAGGAPYEMMQTYNPQTGQMEYHPKTAVMGAQGAPGAGGPVGSLYGQRGGGGAGIAAGAPLGTPEAAGAYGKFSGGAFGDIQQVAANSPQALQSLREMTQLVGDGKVSTGPNSAKLQEIGQHYGLDFLTRPGNFVFNKDAARYIAQSAQGLGLNGSDQRLGLLSSATPGQVMPTAALNQVLPVVQGLEMAKMAHADMAGQWAQAHPNDIGGFQTFWRRNYDPEMFTAMSKGTADFQKNYLNKKLSPMQRNVALGKMRALAGAGVNFSAFDQ